MLLEHCPEAQVMQPDDRNVLPIHLGCQRSATANVEVLLKYFPEQQLMYQSQGKYPMSVACAQNATGVLKLLLQHVPDQQIEANALNLDACQSEEILHTIVDMFASGALKEDLLQHICAQEDCKERLVQQILQRRAKPATSALGNREDLCRD